MLQVSRAIPHNFIVAAPRARGQVRGMASAKQLKQRMKTVKTIIKVTKAMKMIASAKVKRLVANMFVAREYSKDISEMMDFSESKVQSGEKSLLVAYAADRGLCGSANSLIVKEAKNAIERMIKAGAQPSVYTVGNKSVSGLLRGYEKIIRVAVSDSKPGKTMTFKQVSVMAEAFRALNWDRAEVVFNKFRNAASFRVTKEYFQRFDTKVPLSKTLNDFEFEGDQDILRNLEEFRIVVRMWHIWSEMEACEFSARVNAMESSTKAAKDLSASLLQKSNRLRQSKITTEICDLVAGSASAM